MADPARRMRLRDGTLWPIPITLDVGDALADTLSAGDHLALRDPEGVMLAALHVEEVWHPDREAEAAAVFGTASREHPGVAHRFDRTEPAYIGGRGGPGWWRSRPATPCTAPHHELTLRAAKEIEASLLIHPVVGMTKPGDVAALAPAAGDAHGGPFYGPYAELGVAMVSFELMVYVEDSGGAGDPVPWFTFPAVADELARSHQPRHRQGFMLLFTGLSELTLAAMCATSPDEPPPGVLTPVRIRLMWMAGARSWLDLVQLRALLCSSSQAVRRRACSADEA